VRGRGFHGRADVVRLAVEEEQPAAVGDAAQTVTGAPAELAQLPGARARRDAATRLRLRLRLHGDVRAAVEVARRSVCCARNIIGTRRLPRPPEIYISCVNDLRHEAMRRSPVRFGGFGVAARTADAADVADVAYDDRWLASELMTDLASVSAPSEDDWSSSSGPGTRFEPWGAESPESLIDSALLAVEALEYVDMSPPKRSEIKSMLEMVRVARAGDVVTTRGAPVTGVFIVMSPGPAVINDETGERIGIGHVVGVKALVFDAADCDATTVTGVDDCQLAFLASTYFGCAAWVRFRARYLLGRVPALRRVPESTVDSLRFRLQPALAGDPLDLCGRAGVLVSGVVVRRPPGGGDGDAYYYPGHVLMDGSGVTAQSECTYAEILDDGYDLLCACDDFVVATIESAYHRTALKEVSLATRQRSQVLLRCESVDVTTIVPLYSVADVERVNGTLTRVNEFTILGRMGQGITATAYECATPDSGRGVMKAIARRLSESSLRREVVAMQALRHPNIVRLLAVIDDVNSDTVYLLQEMGHLGSLVNVTFEWPYEVVRVARDVADALAHMHAVGFIHRDVKPANIVRTHAGTSKLIDFGCAVHVGHVVRGTVGTPAFTAPELCAGAQATAAVDVWAFAATMHYVVHGRPPFYAYKRAHLDDAIMYGAPDPGLNSHYARAIHEHWTDGDITGFTHFCSQGLVKDPNRRRAMADMRAHEWLGQQ
jgi:hypothetical protein